MSNGIRYDSLLVRDLADELNSTFAGARLEAAFLERESLRVTLLTRAPRRGAAAAPSLHWQLHPESGHLTRVAKTGRPDSGRIQLSAGATIARVTAPPDERLLEFELEAHDASPGMARRIIIELITNQWNAVAVGADERITGVLRERDTRQRVLRAGVMYEPPARSQRVGATRRIRAEEWAHGLGDAPAGQRLGALLRFAAYTSPLNAATIIGDADVVMTAEALERARVRYHDIVHAAPRTPCIAHMGARLQPYSVPLGAEVEITGSLLEAFERVAERLATAPAAVDETDAVLSAIAKRAEALDRRIERLHEELTGAAAEATQLRAHADLLLARLAHVPRGAEHVVLQTFEGGTAEIELDPALAPAQNATRLYDQARKRDRAAERIPRLIDTAGNEHKRLDELAERVRSGAAAPEELAQLRSRGRISSRADAPALPYREYRTSGGIEVRVGRGSKANDDLTFRHSKPTDIWLHARDVAGAHVIMRWPHASANPPASDIAEAAVLAALHSRARTSGMVAVDWTRRKYVRKPRRSAPGLVVPERVRTLFVEPDRRLEERLRAEAWA